MNPISLALTKSREGNTGKTSQGGSSVSRAFAKVANQGVNNKMKGIVIKTDSTTTFLGNKTCQLCLNAKRTGAPLPPQHKNCRCQILKQ